MKIPMDQTSRQRYYGLLDQVFDSNFWSEGAMVQNFEETFAQSLGNKCHALAMANGGLSLLALLEAADVAGGDVIVPSNTFMATVLAVKRAGADVILADCNRDDLCLSFEDMKKRITPNTKAVVVVHIGGHIAFQIKEIAAYLAEKNIPLIEDCAHAHGASYHGTSAGCFGLGGAYSFYATKTMPLGEGGMVVTKDKSVAQYIAKWRNYGKFEYDIPGYNARMNEFTAALGLVQLERLPAILNWKNDLAAKYDQIFDNHVHLPEGMISGFYKYIVFGNEPREQTGKVFDPPCHQIMRTQSDLPNTDWVSANHYCPPMYYGWNGAGLSVDELRKRLLS
jgi:perosamine synthetase